VSSLSAGKEGKKLDGVAEGMEGGKRKEGAGKRDAGVECRREWQKASSNFAVWFIEN
jgi:hypothetical protein